MDKHEDNTFELSVKRNIEANFTYNDEENHSTRLYKARSAKGLSIINLAKLSKVSKDTIINVELGRHVPTLKVLSKISKVLEVDIGNLGCFEDMPEDNFGNIIKKARYYHGHTQLKASEFFKVQKDTFADWENNKHTPSSLYKDKIQSYISILSRTV